MGAPSESEGEASDDDLPLPAAEAAGPNNGVQRLNTDVPALQDDVLRLILDLVFK